MIIKETKEIDVLTLAHALDKAKDTAYKAVMKPKEGTILTVIRESSEALQEYVKGFFFVRQKRMPLTLAQGIVVGLDKESRTPTLPTIGGAISDINHSNSFVETSDINDINYDS